MKLLSEFDALELAQDYSITTYKPISAGVSSQFFGIMGMLDALEANIANATPVKLTPQMPYTTIGSLCRTVLNSANTTGFASDPTKEDGLLNRAGAQKLVDNSIFNQALVDLFWSKSTVISNPHENATQAQFNSTKDLYKSIAISYQPGEEIIITLNADLPEKVAVTVWRKEVGFNDENAGRNVHIQTANKYRIDMSGKKPGNYEVRVPLLDADFSVELI
tara:strand:+ start:5299 stop:5958 length:660 start_codon:yes stop_codon:yes gene_type:complete